MTIFDFGQNLARDYYYNTYGDVQKSDYDAYDTKLVMYRIISDTRKQVIDNHDEMPPVLTFQIGIDEKHDTAIREFFIHMGYEYAEIKYLQFCTQIFPLGL